MKWKIRRCSGDPEWASKFNWCVESDEGTCMEYILDESPRFRGRRSAGFTKREATAIAKALNGVKK